jgi:hypothetical protein
LPNFFTSRRRRSWRCGFWHFFRLVTHIHSNLYFLSHYFPFSVKHHSWISLRCKQYHN